MARIEWGGKKRAEVKSEGSDHLPRNKRGPFLRPGEGQFELSPLYLVFLYSVPLIMAFFLRAG